MLKQRIVTALVLLGIVLPILFYGDVASWAVLMLIFLTAGAWEWGRLQFSANKEAGHQVLGNQRQTRLGVACAGAVLVLVLVWWLFVSSKTTLNDPKLALVPAAFWRVVAVIWSIFIVSALSMGVEKWQNIPIVLRFVLGVFFLFAAWLAIVALRVRGVQFLLSVLCLVWAADIGAYFFGKGLGQKLFKQKLAPTISPGKSREGALGGFVCVLLLAAVWAVLDVGINTEIKKIPGSFYGFLLQNAQILWMGAILLGLTAASVCGDLVESLIKRSAGVKDSSQLLPGHGGVLDRVDALLPVLPMVLAVVTCWQ